MIGRAFAKALRQEIKLSQEAAKRNEGRQAEGSRESRAATARIGNLSFNFSFLDQSFKYRSYFKA